MMVLFSKGCYLLRYKVLCCLQGENIWVAVLQNWYIFAKNYYLHFTTLQFLLCIISKSSSFLWKKKNWDNFWWTVLLFVGAQKVFLRFLKSSLRLEISIFLSFIMSFFYVQLKSSFSDSKTAVKSETYFSREAIRN